MKHLLLLLGLIGCAPPMPGLRVARFKDDVFVVCRPYLGDSNKRVARICGEPERIVKGGSGGDCAMYRNRLHRESPWVAGHGATRPAH